MTRSNIAKRRAAKPPPKIVKATSPVYARWGSWLGVEDAAMLEAIAVHGTQNWSVIAPLVVGRSSKQCRERWINNLDPELNKAIFTTHEDTALEIAVHCHGRAWARIAYDVFLGRRNDSQLKNRWMVLTSRRRMVRVMSVPAELNHQQCEDPIQVEASAVPALAALEVETCELDAFLMDIEPHEAVSFLPRLEDSPVAVAAAAAAVAPLPELPTSPITVTAAHLHKDHDLLPPPAKTTNYWKTVIKGTLTGIEAPRLSDGPFVNINRALKRFPDARNDAWDGLPLRFKPLVL